MSYKSKLAEAVYRGDLDAARDALWNLAQDSDRWAVICQMAKKKGAPPPQMPDLPPFPLPVPGHLFGSTLGDPKIAA
jgi:hypothetical protein